MHLVKAVVESVVCYGCEDGGTKKIISSINGLFKVSYSVQITKKSQTPSLGARYKQNNTFRKVPLEDMKN